MGSHKCIFLMISILMHAGCAGEPYPTSDVTTAVGMSSKCENCRKTVPAVTEEQYAVLGASRFVVCDEQCLAQLKRKMEAQ